MAAVAAPAIDIKAQPRRRVRIKLTLVGGLLLLAMLIIVAIAPAAFAPYGPTEFDYAAILQAPSAAHPFGADNFGRDIFSRVIWATRLDLQIALFTTLIPFLFGTFVGCLTGYYGRWLDAIFGRIVDVVVVFPFLILVIAIVAFLGPGLTEYV
ncbi:MAG: hypothetical protein R2911_19085 [Caldilineaceae bacterium]